MKKACLGLLITIFTVLLSPTIKASSTIKIDGNFSDWKDKSILKDRSLRYSMVTQDNNVYIMTTSNEKIPLNYKLNFGKQNCSTIELQELNKSDGIHKISYLLDYKKENQKLGKGYLNKHGRRQQIEIEIPLNKINQTRNTNQISYIQLTILNKNRDSIDNGDVSTLPQWLGF